MNKILTLILTLFCCLNLFGQQENKIETIPLEKDIEIVISSIDSTSFELYDIYEFTYFTTNKDVNARFWVNKNDTTLERGKVNLKLCRIFQMETEDGLKIRGCAFYNGLAILKNDSIVREFDFNEYGESPTLRLCSTE
ncbi:MAG: hypothetical protein NXI09_05610 [Bacteroidetes bacterium]|nr:hypothetical protein [Bacteroidota bacterium]